MAFRDTTDTDSLPNFYNVTHAVGPGAPNNRDDVQLVQFFLKRVFAARPDLLALESDMAIDGVDLAIDGIFGPITASFIVAFQDAGRRLGKSVKMDGRVDTARGATSSISHTIYTILHLNASFKTAEPSTDFDNLQTDPDVPPALASAIGPPS